MNYDLANYQANRISSDAEDLQHALKRLTEYRSSINANWNGPEVVHINKAIDDVITMIKKTIGEMNQLSTDVKKTAAEIKSEEKAAAAKAMAEKEKRVRAAQDKLDMAVEELSALNDRKQFVEKQINLLKNNILNVPKITMLVMELNEINAKIKTAEQNCENCIIALNEAKR